MRQNALTKVLNERLEGAFFRIHNLHSYPYPLSDYLGAPIVKVEGLDTQLG